MTLFGDYMRINEKGHLQIEGWDAVDLAERFGTPLYIYSENAIRSNYREFLNAFKSRYPKVEVYYEHKVNESLAVKKILLQEGAGADLATMVELYEALMVGYNPAKILLSSNNKSEDVIRAAVASGVTINVDNLEELATIDGIAAEHKIVQPINLRIKIPFTGHKEAAAMHHAAKFGVSIPIGEAFSACEKAIAMKNVKLNGFQFHHGLSPGLELFKVIVSEIMDFAGELKTTLGWMPQFLDLGGGFMGKEWWLKRKASPLIDEYAKVIVDTLKRKLKEHDLSEPTLAFEPGRYIVSNAGVLLGRVGSIKEWPGFKKWVAVDITVNQLQRVWQEKVSYDCIVANRANAEPVEKVDIVGPLSVRQDVIRGWPHTEPLLLPKVQRGDLIAVLNAGAYSESVDSQYCSVPRPATVLVCGRNVDEIRRRETLYDMISRDKVPAWLLPVRL